MKFRFGYVGASILLALAPPAGAARSITIEAGPTTMTAEERAIEADPAAGIEHAVILVEETFRDEDEGGSSETTYHLRAKILSNEGRDLANVEIPVSGSGNPLREWWGRVILPDGQSAVLPQSRLESQAVVRSGGMTVEVLKAALPGAVPGCVIDYGYRVHSRGIQLYNRVPIQREHPVREFLYRWKPFGPIQGAYSIHRAEGMEVKTTVERNEVVVRARDVPPFTREPVMPPDHEVQASLVTYYIEPESSFEGFWSDLGRHLDFLAAAGKKRSARQALETMGIPAEGAGLEERLRAVYDWLADNVVNEGLRTFEEMQQATDDNGSSNRDVIADVLASRRGTSLELQQLFIGVARELGAEAHFVLVPDRTRNLLDPELKSVYQFDNSLVAVRPEGATGDSGWIVDPGSGLPFGEVPWRNAGTEAMELGKKVERVVGIPVGSAATNVALSQVEIVFNEDNDGMVSKWTSSGTGQVGDDERRYLRSLSPAERSRWIDSLCGDGSSIEVIEAEVVGLDELGRDFELNCEVENWDIQVGEHIGVYEFGWNGPWMQALPELRDEQRRYAVVFDYPRVDALELTTAGPRGFVLEDPPAPTKIENRFGSYELRIERVDAGAKVSRALAIFPLVVQTDEYDELRGFLDEVARLDRTALRFRRDRSQP